MKTQKSAELRWTYLSAAEKREEDAVRDLSRGEEGRVCRCEGRVERNIAEGEDAVIEKSDNSNEKVVAKKTSTRLSEVQSTRMKAREIGVSKKEEAKIQKALQMAREIWSANVESKAQGASGEQGGGEIKDGDGVGVGGVGAADGGVCGEGRLGEIEGKEVLVDLVADAGALEKGVLIHEGVVQCTAVVEDREMDRVFSNSVQSTKISLPLTVKPEQMHYVRIYDNMPNSYSS